MRRKDPSSIPLILVSGLGTDERVFAPQKNTFDQLIVPAWLEPMPRETLCAYAKRMAASIDPGGPCYLGGASFGGILAIEMAHHLDARAVLLVGSVRSPRELPTLARWMRPLARLASLLPADSVRYGSCCLRKSIGPFLRTHERQMFTYLEDTESSFLQWSILAMLLWRSPVEKLDVPVLQIHGDRDRAFPIRNTKPTKVVRGGGHVLSLTHADEVNSFLSEAMA